MLFLLKFYSELIILNQVIKNIKNKTIKKKFWFNYYLLKKKILIILSNFAEG